MGPYKNSEKTAETLKFGLIIKKYLKILVICGAVLAVSATAVGFAVFGNGNIDQTKYSLSYAVTALPEAGGVDVAMSFAIEKLSSDRKIFLYRGLVSGLWGDCTDDKGAKVPFEESDDVIALGPIDGSAKTVELKYHVGVGVEETESTYETTYVYGCIFDDLLSFSGEYALLTPFLDPDSFSSMDKYVRSVSIGFVTPEGWQAVLPFETPLGDSRTITKDRPTWAFFNTISKSAFSFGYFEKFDYGGALADVDVYMDKAIMSEINQYALDALVTFVGYFSDIFGGSLDVPIVLLRNNPVSGLVITGGVGGGSAAVSINLKEADDFRALANVVYHAFFDSKIKPRNLRYTTNDWIYKGMAEYYVGLSAALLPEHIRDAYGIDMGDSQTERYLRYLYFSLKEPGFLALSPADESVMYDAQRDFYINVKVPVLIETINYSIQRKAGLSDGFAKTLAEKGTSEKPIDVEKLIRDICGNDYEAIKMYIAGLALMPNFNQLSADSLPADEIVYILDQEEQYYAYLFNKKNLFYPYMPVFLLNEEPFMEEVAKRGIRYNTDDIQAAVKAFSPVLDRILLQYAMWGSLAGIDDITTPNIIRILSQPDVVEEWTVLCEEIGYEVAITSSIKG